MTGKARVTAPSALANPESANTNITSTATAHDPTRKRRLLLWLPSSLDAIGHEMELDDQRLITRVADGVRAVHRHRSSARGRHGRDIWLWHLMDVLDEKHAPRDRKRLDDEPGKVYSAGTT